MQYRLDRCIFCAQCVQNCRFKCLELTNEEWELAALDKTPFTIYYGPEEHIQAYCEGQTESQAQP
jgi:formate hydrogenlyase subunit 6/NADH:ubiquinone oxidoreductase subunit I